MLVSSATTVDVYQGLLEYALKWFSAVSAEVAAASGAPIDDTASNRQRSLAKTGALTAALFVQARPDLIRRGTNMARLLSVLTLAMSQDVSRLRASDVAAAAVAAPIVPASITGPREWFYHSAICIERLCTAALPAAYDQHLFE